MPTSLTQLLSRLVFCSLWLCLTPFLRAQEISYDQPEDWDWVKDDLTPIKAWQDLPPVPKRNDEDPEVESIIRNTYYRVYDDHSYLRVFHSVNLLRRESGKEDFSTDTISFRPSKDKVHIIWARTILADGKIVPVERKGIFIENAKSSNEAVMFTDTKKVKIVFPQVSPGVFVETLFAIRSETPKITGHWSYGSAWKWVYPVRQRKLSLQLPASLKESLVWKAKGLDLSAPKRDTIEGGKGDVRFIWSGKNLHPIKLENGMPWIGQTGPWFEVGSGEGWDEFGNWYWDLIAGASSDTSSLKEVAKKWSGEAESKEEVARNLFRAVSQDIRYTGLEFGDGAFQPRDPAEVQRTRYGDCKDKSNLLRILLQHHGIKSRIALLDTKLPGTISRVSASTQKFNHAILAVDFPGSPNPVFCDPTLDGVPFGVLSQASSLRDVLLIDEDGKIEWSKTPESEREKFEMSSDLRLEPDGAFSGWIDVTMSGATGWLIHRNFEKKSRDGRIKDGLSWFLGMINGVLVVDVDLLSDGKTSLEEDNGRPAFHCRFYVLRKGQSDEESGKTVGFRLPAHRWQLTPVGSLREAAKRVYPFLVNPIETNVSVNLQLPDDWKIVDHPPKRSYSDNGYEVSASWTTKDRKLIGETTQIRSRRNYSVSGFKDLAEQVVGIAKWLDAPVILKKPKPEEDAEPWSPAPEKLPEMPSPDGFNVLINERFPFDSKAPFDADHEARLKAFRRMEALYPDDEGRFISKSMIILSRLFLFETEESNLVAESQQLVKEYQGKVSEEKIAGAEFLVLASLAENGDRDAAIKIAENLIKRESAPVQIRHAAASILAPLISEEDPERGIEMAALGMKLSLLLPDDEWAGLAIISLDCFARLPGNGSDEIQAELQRFLVEWPEKKEVLRTWFLQGPDLLLDYNHLKEARQFNAALTALGKADPWPKDDVEEWKEAIAAFEKIDAIIPHHKKLISYFKDHEWEDMDKIEEGDHVESASEAWVGMDGEDEGVDFRYGLRALIGFGPQLSFTDDLGDQIDMGLFWIEDYRDDPESFTKPPKELEQLLEWLISFLKNTPDGEYTDSSNAIFSEGRLLKLQSGALVADSFYLKLAQDKSTDSESRLRAIGLLQALRAEEKDLEKYIAVLALYESLDYSDYWTQNARAESIYLHLLKGDWEQALPFVEKIAKSSGEELGKAQLRAITKFNEDHDAAMDYWKSSAKWWPQWLDLAKQMKIKNVGEEDWENYSPWKKLTKKGLRIFSKESDEKKREKMTRRLLRLAMNHARWHSEGNNTAVNFLSKHAQVLFPGLKEEIVELTKSMQAIREKQ